MRSLIKLIIVLILIALQSGCEKEQELLLEDIQLEETEREGVPDESEKLEESKIFVHVCGEVKKPGVYELEPGSRIYEAIEQAGGTTPQAAKDSLNQAEVLEDGQKIYVPSKKELAEQESKGMTDGKVDLNQASKEELMTLSGVGEAKADAIIQYRQQQGGFDSIEEIMEIEGIKEGVFGKIKDQITVS